MNPTVDRTGVSPPQGPADGIGPLARPVLVAISVIHLAWWVERRVGLLPATLGWLLLGFTAVTVLLVPGSGFWLFLAPAAVVLARARRLRTQSMPA